MVKLSRVVNACPWERFRWQCTSPPPGISTVYDFFELLWFRSFRENASSFALLSFWILFCSVFSVRFFLVFIVLSYERVSGGSTVYDFFRELLFRSFRKTPASFALLSFCHLLFWMLFSFVFSSLPSIFAHHHPFKIRSGFSAVP